MDERGISDLSLSRQLLDLGISNADLEVYVDHNRSGQYLLVAGITLLLYDYFCTLNEEIQFVWMQRPRLVPAKILFALNRYVPFLTLTLRFSVFNETIYNPLACKFTLLSATGFMGVINIAIVETVLLLRVWVLYSKKLWIGIMLWSLYITALALALVIKYLQPHVDLPFITPPTYGDNRCSKVASGEMFFIYGVVCIVESVFFTMLIIKAIISAKNSMHTPILTALLKQGTLYYFVVLLILAVTMLAPFSYGLYFPVANAFPIVPITSVACNRLILSLRGMVFSKEVVRSGMGIPSGGAPPRYPSSQGQSSSSGQYPVPPLPYSNPRPISNTHQRINSQILKSSRPFAFNVTPAQNSTSNLDQNNGGHIDGTRASFEYEESKDSNSFPMKSILPLQPHPTKKFLPFTTPSRALSPPPRTSRSTSPPPSTSPQSLRSKSSVARPPSGIRVTVNRTMADEGSFGTIPSPAEDTMSPMDMTFGGPGRPASAPNRRPGPSGVIVVTAPPRPRTAGGSGSGLQALTESDVIDISQPSGHARHPYAQG